MGDKPNGKDTEPIPVSEYHVYFQEPGSAHFKTHGIGIVTVEQLGALKDWLDWFVDRQRGLQASAIEAAMQNELNRSITVPSLILPKDLKPS